MNQLLEYLGQWSLFVGLSSDGGLSSFERILRLIYNVRWQRVHSQPTECC